MKIQFELIDASISDAEKTWDLQMLEDILRLLHQRVDYIIRRLPHVAAEKKRNVF